MTPSVTLTPSEATASAIFSAHFPDGVRQITRFPTGMCHFVYEIQTTTNKAYVVRIATQDTRSYVEGALHWYPYLRDAGVPIPELYASNVATDMPYTVIARLPGSDLGEVYYGLGPAAKRAVAEAVASIQRMVSALPRPRRYGFAFSYDHANTEGHSSWADVVKADVCRSEERIRRVGRIDPTYVARVRDVLSECESYFRTVDPVPFLDDTTTKNVIVHEGKLSGIVDTDEVCFGDCLFAVGLTKMALLGLGADTDYVEFWLDAIKASTVQRRMVSVYALVFCTNFMGELGQVFNKEIPFSLEEAETLCTIFENLIGELSGHA
jgi:Ser/Thr protein kinase RdoA (MazF antagonist)